MKKIYINGALIGGNASFEVTVAPFKSGSLMDPGEVEVGFSTVTPTICTVYGHTAHY